MGYVNSTRAASSSFPDRVSAVANSIQGALARRRMFSQTARELNALTDRELADLGIDRSSIREIAMQAACGR